ncbi:MAG: beta-phosphoglucomutase family hydrolase [Desulfurellaceae bacterium]|nr:beta-phosphoglucomutase family hydrolase [Desulfurellaceae bacterium]
MSPPHSITPERFEAVLFDLDGVLTATAKVHAACWKRMFDEFLQHQARCDNSVFVPFDIRTDYPRYVDGKPRYEGVQSFLAARGLCLPYGNPDDPPQRRTVCGLGNRKNDLIQTVLAADGVETYPDALSVVRAMRAWGLKTAVVSSSRNCPAILEAAHMADLFELRLDGGMAADLKLKGKPAPDTFLAAARQLGVPPQRAVVIEDALVGVQAGRAGGFGLVVGVARRAQAGEAQALREHGADIVVTDLRDLIGHD